MPDRNRIFDITDEMPTRSHRPLARGYVGEKEVLMIVVSWRKLPRRRLLVVVSYFSLIPCTSDVTIVLSALRRHRIATYIDTMTHVLSFYNV